MYLNAYININSHMYILTYISTFNIKYMYNILYIKL